MEKNTIKRLTNYYFTNPKFKADCLRAYKQFFGKTDIITDDEFPFQDEAAISLFNEWFVFDFKLSNGKTPLEDFYYRNPYKLSIDRLQVYKDLLDNHYGFYKVRKVEIGTGMLLENLQTKEVYAVKEFSATLWLKEYQIFPARVARVGDHYELVCSIHLLPARFDSELEKMWRRSHKKWNPKVLWDTFFKEKKPRRPFILEQSPEEIENDFRTVLSKYGLEKFVSVDRIKDWIYNRSESHGEFIRNMLLSLLPPDRPDYNQAFGEILDSFNRFYNICPQKNLEGKSPLEKSYEIKEKGVMPDMMFTLKPFPHWTLYKKYSQAMSVLENYEFKKGLKKIDDIFAYMLKHKITYPEIYRLYFNKGACYLNLGEMEKGKYFIELAFEFNPYYEMAKKTLMKLQEVKPLSGGTKSEELINDPGYQYYLFIKPYGINFAHLE